MYIEKQDDEFETAYKWGIIKQTFGYNKISYLSKKMYRITYTIKFLFFKFIQDDRCKSRQF